MLIVRNTLLCINNLSTFLLLLFVLLATFSAFQWSPDNKRLLYVAEKKLPKNEPFYKQKTKPKTTADKPDDEEEPSKV